MNAYLAVIETSRQFAYRGQGPKAAEPTHTGCTLSLTWTGVYLGCALFHVATRPSATESPSSPSSQVSCLSSTLFTDAKAPGIKLINSPQDTPYEGGYFEAVRLADLSLTNLASATQSRLQASSLRIYITSSPSNSSRTCTTRTRPLHQVRYTSTPSRAPGRRVHAQVNVYILLVPPLQPRAQ